MTFKTLQIGLGWFPEHAGGLDRYYYDCCRYLPDAGVEVRGLVAGSEQVLADSGGQVSAFAPHTASVLARWQKLRQASQPILQTEAVPLVVSHFALYTLPLLNLLGKKPLVVHFHGPWALESILEQPGNRRSLSTQAKFLLEQRVYRRASHCIVLSQAFAEILHREYRVPMAQIHVIPGGVDGDRFQTPFTPAEARAKLGWDGDRPTLVTVRRLARRMGLENLIAAIAQVRLHQPDILLHIVGKGELSASLQAQIDELDLNNHVRLLGYIPDEQLGLIYRAANFSIVPTIALEGFGLIVVESLAAGTPVLGTPIGGIPEILQPFSPDLLLEGSEPNQLAQGILEVLAGQRQLPSASDCQTYVQQHYEWRAIAGRIREVYELAI
ncbi:MAG: glycosyltransferase family 4 protein [Oculatellaceae cyanobacterium Prado106]|jgi:glycosyltransferase involved in cell wall biosynthesis|nr:glycosyltransferase family 4 protein [Oculatellaceae cyanobacterium Prado106]